MLTEHQHNALIAAERLASASVRLAEIDADLACHGVLSHDFMINGNGPLNCLIMEAQYLDDSIARAQRVLAESPAI